MTNKIHDTYITMMIYDEENFEIFLIYKES